MDINQQDPNSTIISSQSIAELRTEVASLKEANEQLRNEADKRIGLCAELELKNQVLKSALDGHSTMTVGLAKKIAIMVADYGSGGPCWCIKCPSDHEPTAATFEEFLKPSFHKEPCTILPLLLWIEREERK